MVLGILVPYQCCVSVQLISISTAQLTCLRSVNGFWPTERANIVVNYGAADKLTNTARLNFLCNRMVAILYIASERFAKSFYKKSFYKTACVFKPA